MTKINKLIMHGFKSFAKRTEMVFGDEFNCVLGPNGSGKSNIIDALCFVLGKSSAKALRTEKSANLIYNGGKKKKPSEFAEVSIVFDNKDKTFPTDADEVKVSRKVRKNGQSIYKINDESRTRQQILELTSMARIDPDAYSIIMQGDIVRFVEMPPDDRRGLIEDIAGISIYEDKKLKAVGELDRVEERLKETEIVLNERKTRLNELKKEKEQATKFKELKDKIKINKASLIYKQISRKKEETDAFDKRISGNKEKLEVKNAELIKIKEEIKICKTRIDEINHEIEQKGEKEQIDINKNIENLRINIASSKNRNESVKNEISKIKQRRTQLKQNLEELQSKIKKVQKDRDEIQKIVDNRQKELNSIEKRLKEFREKNNLDSVGDLDKQIDTVDKEAEAVQKNIQDMRQEQQELMREKDRIEVQIDSINEKITKVLQVEKENEGQFKELKTKKEDFKKLTADLVKRTADSSALIAQLENARISQLRAQEDLSKFRTRKMSVEEKMGENSALKKLLDQKSSIGGIYGTVSELGKVPSKYGVALEVAAGHKTTSVVVSDEKVASQCIRYLKDNRLGIVTFLPLNKIKPRNNDPEASKLSKAGGVHGFALDLISYDPRFANVFSYVFGNALIVDSIDTARRIGIGKAKMVTLDGDISELSGAMQGGFRKKGSSGLGFSEKEIDNEIKIVEKKEKDAALLLERLEDDRMENEKIMSEIRQKKANLEGDIIKIEKVLHLDMGDTEASKKAKEELTKIFQETDKKVDAITNKISEYNSKLAQNKIKRQEIRNKINELRNPALLAELNAFEEKKNQLKDDLINKQGEVKTFNTQIENIFHPEENDITKVIKQLEKEEIEFKEEIVLTDKTLTDMGVELKEKEIKQKQFQSKFRELFVEKGKIDDKIKKNDDASEMLNEHIREVEQKINEINVESAKTRAELGALEEEFREFEGIQILKNKSEQDMRKDIGISEGVVTRLGTVNMKSLEIFDQAEKEYGELSGKKEKLIAEKEDVLIMINTIELKKKDIFIKTFDVVNENFKNIFSALSTKGEASLVLENQESPLEGGLLVKVRMAGTRFMDIRSLSGGEKTMTALAFIFAIQEHEPAPFYVFDEVDAALDKKNSEKLSQLVKKYSERAQYIIISHNDGIISDADILYGVSMNEHGVSQIVSMKV